VEFGVGDFVDGGNNEPVHDAGYRENEDCDSADSEVIHRRQSCGGALESHFRKSMEREVLGAGRVALVQADVMY